MTYQNFHHTTASSDSNATMVNFAEEQLPPSPQQQQQQQQSQQNNSHSYNTSNLSIRSKGFCSDRKDKQQYIVTSNNSSTITDGDEEGFDKSPSVILEFSSKPPSLATSEKYAIGDTGILNNSSTEKGNENGIITTTQHQEDDDLYNNSSSSKIREWITVFSSGVMPFGKPAWPPVFIWIIIILLFFVMSGELLVSKETVGKR